MPKAFRVGGIRQAQAPRQKPDQPQRFTFAQPSFFHNFLLCCTSDRLNMPLQKEIDPLQFGTRS
jgi:hypothetical protein